MSYVGVRAGVFAVLDGREYEASPPTREDGTVLLKARAGEDPDSSRFGWSERIGQWRARVPTAELDRIYQAIGHARYGGRPVNITQIDDSGVATAYSTGQADGFSQVDRGVWVGDVPVWTLRDVHEVQIDLLFRQWRQADLTARRPRTGLFAMVTGREYRAEFASSGRRAVILVGDTERNPDPALFKPHRQSDEWRAQVRVEQCERLDEVMTMALYRGHECQVTVIEPDGSVRLHFCGPDRSKAARDGFVQTEPDVMVRMVNICDLARLWERHADLLFSAYYGTPAK
jgi:hypothetical protein